MNKIFLKNSLEPTKLEILRSKVKLLVLTISLIIQLGIGPCLATKVIGDRKLKTKGLISKVEDDFYRLSRDNTLDFIYTYKDSSEKTFSEIPIFPNGNIVIPNLGEEHVFGMTIDQVQSLILQKVNSLEKVEIFIKRIPNNFSVLGEVKNPGSFKLDDIRTIYDGIAKAQGFTDIAKKSDVKLIRQREDGYRYTYVIDFPKEVFNAYDDGTGIGKDAYLLKEGDLIYVTASTPKKIWKIFKQGASAATLGVFAGLIGGAIN